MQCQAIEILKSTPNSYVQDSTFWHTFTTHLSILSSLIFIKKIYYIYFFIFLLCAWYAQQPTTGTRIVEDKQQGTLLSLVTIPYCQPSPAAVLLLFSQPSIIFAASVNGLMLYSLPTKQHTN
jgi:hypothetical protein